MKTEGDKGLKCPVCRHNAAFYRKLEKTTLFYCCNCTHRFTDIAIIDSKEEYSEEYYEKKHANWFDNPNISLFDYIYSQIESLGLKNPSVLDIGCGNGDFLRHLYSKSDALQLIGIDYHENKPLKGIEFLCGDIFKTDFDKKFDVIVNLAVIEHVWDVHSYMERLSQLCNDGGLVITMTVNDNSLVYIASRIIHSFGLKAPMERLYEKHHLNHFSSGSLEYLHQHASLDVIDRYLTRLPVKTVDMPDSNSFITLIYKTSLAVLFKLERILKQPILQTITTRRFSVKI